MKVQNRKIDLRTVLVLLICSILLTSFATYIVFSNPDLSYTTIIQEGSMNLGISFSIFRDGSTYYARNGESGAVTSSGNATYLISLCIENAENGTVNLQTDYYDLDSPIVISHSVKLVGAGHTNDVPTNMPDYYPTKLYGTVLRSSSAINMIEIQGAVFNVEIRDIGIEFTGESTGHGIKAYNPDAPTEKSYGLTYGVFENIAVLNNDGTHYAFYFENFQHLVCNLLRSWGGAFLYLKGNDNLIQYGNSVFSECYTYAYKTTSLSIMEVTTSGVWTGNWTNLMQFNRLQLNCFGSAPRCLYLHNVRLTTFVALEIETTLAELIKIDEHSLDIVFINPFFWSTHENSIIWADSDCTAISFIEGWFDIASIQLKAVPNLLLNPHWLSGYRPVFYEPTNCIIFDNYTIATQSCNRNGVVSEGEDHIDIFFTPSPTFNQTDTNYGVVVTPNWNTTVWVTDKATSGFTINFGTNAPANAKFDYFIFRRIT